MQFDLPIVRDIGNEGIYYDFNQYWYFDIGSQIVQ